jgi:hypothetical protein
MIGYVTAPSSRFALNTYFRALGDALNGAAQAGGGAL